MRKSNWEGNGWPSIDFDDHEYEYADFLIVVSLICEAFALEIPVIVDTLDGYMIDLEINNDQVSILLDNWTFSLATRTTELRDEIFSALEPVLN